MFINMDLGGVVEAKPVEAGRYPLTVAKAEYRPPKAADKGATIQVSIGIDGHADAPNITHFISLPKAGEEPSKTAFKKLMLKRFLSQFGVPFNESEGFQVEDLSGAHCDSAQVALSEPDETTGNIYNRLTLDRLPNEPKS